jgi:signal transduction histidine kinase/CheY-like chemotaxis protein
LCLQHGGDGGGCFDKFVAYLLSLCVCTAWVLYGHERSLLEIGMMHSAVTQYVLIAVITFLPISNWFGMTLLALPYLFWVVALVIQWPLNARETDAFGVTLNFLLMQTVLAYLVMKTEAANEQRLAEALDKATESNQVKSKFIAWLSHDLRTPLVGLAGFLEELSESGLNSDQNDRLNKSLICARSITALVTNLLDFSALESNRLPFKRQLFRPFNLFHYLHGLMVQLASEKDIELDFRLVDENNEQINAADRRIAHELDTHSTTRGRSSSSSVSATGGNNNDTTSTSTSTTTTTTATVPGRRSSAGPSVFVWGDWLRLEQIVVNLATNAIKFSPDGSKVKIHVRTKIAPAEQLAPPPPPSPASPSASDSPVSGTRRRSVFSLAKTNDIIASTTGTTQTSAERISPTSSARQLTSTLGSSSTTSTPTSNSTALSTTASTTTTTTTAATPRTSPSPSPSNSSTASSSSSSTLTSPSAPAPSSHMAYFFSLLPALASQQNSSATTDATDHELATSTPTRDRLQVDISVTDSGAGIPERYHANLWTPFFQVERNSSKGSGLGLYIVAEIVRSLGGTVSYENSAARGSVFTVDGLRFDLASEDEINTERSHATTSHEWTARMRRRVHVLLVEDNKFNQAISKRQIEACSFRLTIVANGQEAVDKWKEDNSISIIFMDLQMPIKNGMEATSEIRALERLRPARRRTPIVALTASTNPEEMSAALRSGMNECISKPTSSAVLEDTVWR